MIRLVLHHALRPGERTCSKKTPSNGDLNDTIIMIKVSKSNGNSLFTLLTDTVAN